jgi:hypothetical protein
VERVDGSRADFSAASQRGILHFKKSNHTQDFFLGAYPLLLREPLSWLDWFDNTSQKSTMRSFIGIGRK